MLKSMAPVIFMALTLGPVACGETPSTRSPDSGVLLLDMGSKDQRGNDLLMDRGSKPPSTALCEPVLGAHELVILPITIDTQAPVCAAAELQQTWFAVSSSVAAFYTQASGARLNIQGRVAEPLSIPPFSACIGTDATQNQQLIQSLYPQLDSAAVSAGIAIPQGATRVYILPSSIYCGDKGPRASALPPINRLLIYGDTCESLQISTHELGHLLGTNHAAALESASGQVKDVGDGSDVMGSGLFHPNGPHRAQLGWIPSDKVVEITASATLQLAPLGEDESPRPQLLVIPRRDDPSMSIFVTYRTEAGLPAEFMERTSVHEFPSVCPPREVIPVPKTVLLGTVGDGQDHLIPAAGVSIRQLSHDSSGTAVELQLAD